MLWETIQDVGAGSGGRCNNRKRQHSPGKEQHAPLQIMLESLAVEDQRSEHKQCWEVVSPETVFKNPFALMFLDVSLLEEVVKPLSPEFAQDSPDHGRHPHPCFAC